VGWTTLPGDADWTVAPGLRRRGPL
jgi:hypothetical protein